MDWITKFISPYELRARMLPGLLLVMPAALLLVALVPRFHALEVLTLAATGSFLVGYPVGQWMRDRAQPNQSALFESWGGAPTTQLLRWNNFTISTREKELCREKIIALPGYKWPTASEAALDTVAADNHFKAIVGAVLSNARRHPDRYERMDRASAHFGFLRNCFYSRTTGIIIASASLATCIAAQAFLGSNTDLLSAALGVFGCLLLLLFWIFGVTEQRMHISADAFAVEVFHHIPTFVEGQKS